MISEDEYLERIVAGIQAATTNEADVTWNEVINGRQFDVAVRFAMGTLRYLVLIEVKNRTRKASAEDLDAFVTKARDQLASKAVFVTAAGFQRGAIETAKRHGIELFTVKFDETQLELPKHMGFIALSREGAPPDAVPTLSIGDEEPILIVASLVLIYTDRRRISVPNEPSQMLYYLKKSSFGDTSTLLDFVNAQRFGDIALKERRRERIRLKRATPLIPPDEYCFPAGWIKELELEITCDMVRGLRGNVRIDTGAFRHPVIYTDVLSGKAHRFALDQLPLGGEPVTAGRFYFAMHPLRYYHCAGVKGKLVTWDLIESFQTGDKMSGTYTQDVKYSQHYIPVTDKRIIARLEKRLADYRLVTKGGKPPTPMLVPLPTGIRRWLPRLGR